MLKSIIQESTTTPMMSKWNGIKIDQNNATQYYLDVVSSSKGYETNMDYFKNYYSLVDIVGNVEKYRLDSDEILAIKEMIIENIFDGYSDKDLLNLDVMKNILNKNEEFKKITQEDVKLEIIDFATIKYIDGNGESELLNIDEYLREITYSLEEVILKQKGFAADDLRYIMYSPFKEKIINDELNELDKEMVEYLKFDTMILEEDVPFELESIYKHVQLERASSNVQNEVNLFIKNIGLKHDRASIYNYIENENYKIEDVIELINERDLAHNLKNNNGTLLYNNGFYQIHEIVVNGISVYVDAQRKLASVSKKDLFDSFLNINKEQIIDNLKEFYKNNADDIKYDNYEEAFITDFISEHFGFEILKFRDELVEVNSDIFKNYSEINKNLDEVFKYFKDVPLLANLYLTPSHINEKNFELEIDGANGIFLLQDISVDSNPLYIGKQICTDILENYELSDNIYDEIENVVDEIDQEWLKNIEAELKVLHNIAVELTGSSGFSFSDETNNLRDNYSNMETGTVKMHKYLNNVIEAYYKSEATTVEDIVQLLEVVNKYVSQSEYEIVHIPEFTAALNYILEEPIKELYDFSSSMLDYDFEFSIEDYPNLKAEWIKHIEIILDNKYSSIIDKFDINEVFLVEENHITLHHQYKFIDEDNKICLKNIDWTNTGIEFDVLKAHIDWLEEYHYIEEYEGKEEYKELAKKEIGLYNDGNGKRQDLLDKMLSHIVSTNTSISTNIPQEHLEKLWECSEANNMISDYYNNGLGNYILIPDYDTYDAYYAESVDEYGEIEQEESMSWSEYYTDKISQVNNNDYDIIDKIIDIMELDNYSTDVFTDEIEMLINNNLTKCLENAEEIIERLTILTHMMTTDDEEILKAIDIKTNSELTNLERFSYITGAALRKNVIANQYLEDELKNDEKLMIRQIMLNKNLNKIDPDTRAFLDLNNNPYNVSENYKFYNNHVSEFFNKLPNRYLPEEIRLKIVGTHDIYKHLSIGMPIGEAHGQIIDLLYKKTGSIVTLNDVSAMGFKSLELAKDIITFNRLEKTEEVEIRFHDLIYNKYNRTPSLVERKFDKFLINYHDNWVITKSPLEKLSRCIEKSFVDNNMNATKLLDEVLEENKKEFTEILEQNINSLDKATCMFVYLQQDKLDIDNKYLLNLPQVSGVFNKYEEINNSDKLKSTILENDGIRQNIVQKMSLSTGQKQLMDIANLPKGTIVNRDNICYLDKKNLKFSQSLIEIKGLETTKEVKNIYGALEPENMRMQ